MRKIGLIFCTVLASFCWAQSDSTSTLSILEKLSALERMKSANDSISSVKAITDKDYANQLIAKAAEMAIDTSALQPLIYFDTTEFDLGSITQGDVIKQKFTFCNKGKKVLYVTQIVVDCGCTEPEWSQEAIEPGESGYIIAKYDSKDDIGKIQKNLTVVHNSGDGYSYIMLTGFVGPKL